MKIKQPTTLKNKTVKQLVKETLTQTKVLVLGSRIGKTNLVSVDKDAVNKVFDNLRVEVSNCSDYYDYAGLGINIWTNEEFNILLFGEKVYRQRLASGNIAPDIEKKLKKLGVYILQGKYKDATGLTVEELVKEFKDEIERIDEYLIENFLELKGEDGRYIANGKNMTWNLLLDNVEDCINYKLYLKPPMKSILNSKEFCVLVLGEDWKNIYEKN